MNIYYTDNYGRRRLQGCNLSELEISGVQATDGVETYKIYSIYNDVVDDCATITFGGQEQIAGNLRDCFWKNIKAVYKSGVPLFDVDEWYGNLKFVTPDKFRKRRKIR